MSIPVISITLIIVIVTALVSIRGFSDGGLINKFVFHPVSIDKRGHYYRFLSHGLIHADWLHLMFNMYTLYIFGNMVETLFSRGKGFVGMILFVILYISALISRSLKSYFQYRESPSYSALGALGAVSAVIFAGIALYPQLPIGLLILPFVNFPGWFMGLLFLAFSAYMSKKNYDNIGHDAHFWGAVYGVIFTGIFFFPYVISAWRTLLGL